MAGNDAMMVVDHQEKDLPQWLREIGSANFYSSCKTHPSQERNFYCTICTLAFCRGCDKQHDHFGHQVIKAYQAREEMSFRMKDLKSLWDISHIHKYTFNSYSIVLTKKKGATIAHSRGQNGVAGCESCQYRLKSPSPGDKYCSVECKVEAVMKMNEGEIMKNEAKTKVEIIPEGSVSNVQSFRKQPRKQKHPQGAPLH